MTTTFDNSQRAAPRPPGRRRRPGTVIALVGVAAAVLAAAVGWRLLATATKTSGCTVVAVDGSTTFHLTPEQTQNASIIAAVAIRLGLPDHAVSIALATSLQEAKLRDLPGGDRDSAGLFQQRPSQGWGTRAQILDPLYAATAFYAHLQQVPGWQTMAVTEAAQAVQHSATPDAYAQWETEARSLAVALTGEAPAALACHLAAFAGPPPAPGALDTAAQAELGAPLHGTFPSKAGWQIAEWLLGHAWQYHVRQVTFGGAAWTASGGAWHGAAPTGGTITYTQAP